MRTIAETIGRELGLPVEAVSADSFGVLGTLFAIDQPSTNTLTRQQFGWEPTHPSLLDDLRAGGYPS
jgi:hypothetical protein